MAGRPGRPRASAEVRNGCPALLFDTPACGDVPCGCPQVPDDFWPTLGAADSPESVMNLALSFGPLRPDGRAGSHGRPAVGEFGLAGGPCRPSRRNRVQHLQTPRRPPDLPGCAKWRVGQPPSRHATPNPLSMNTRASWGLMWAGFWPCGWPWTPGCLPHPGDGSPTKRPTWHPGPKPVQALALSELRMPSIPLTSVDVGGWTRCPCHLLGKLPGLRGRGFIWGPFSRNLSKPTGGKSTSTIGETVKLKATASQVRCVNTSKKNMEDKAPAG